MHHKYAQYGAMLECIAWMGPAVHGATSENSVIDWRRWLAPMNPLGNSLDCDNRLSASRSGKAIILNVKTSTNRSLYRCLLWRSLAEFSPLKSAQISTKLSAFSGFNCLDRNLSGFSSQYFMIIYLVSDVVISSDHMGPWSLTWDEGDPAGASLAYFNNFLLPNIPIRRRSMSLPWCRLRKDVGRKLMSMMSVNQFSVLIKTKSRPKLAGKEERKKG